jgi:hypothetical protein
MLVQIRIVDWITQKFIWIAVSNYNILYQQIKYGIMHFLNLYYLNFALKLIQQLKLKLKLNY